MAAPRIAIATPSADAWSETFIEAHVKGLKDAELVLVGGEMPVRALDGSVFLRESGGGRAWDRALGLLHADGLDGLAGRRIARALRRHRIDAVLAEYGTTAHRLLGACRRAGVPLVAHFHGFDAHKERAIRTTGGYRALFAQASAVVAVSRAMEARLLELGADRAKVIYNCCGVDAERFAAGAPEQSPPHFVAVGRFVDKKAPHLTLSAFEELARRVPEARLTMVGQGPLWESCERRARSGILAGRVDLPGVLAPPEVAARLRGARAFVQHSVQALDGDCEGTPVAVLEAMATGIPVVATRHAGIGDVVEHERHGLLCEENDVPAMAGHLERMARNPALAGQMGRAAREKALREHRVEDSIARLQAIIEAAARG